MDDDVTTTTTPNSPGQTTIIERRGGGGGMGLMIGFILLVALAIGAFYLINQNRNEAVKTDAISDAAKGVEKAAGKVGDAAEKAGDAITGNEKKPEKK
ncbi:hypothetical protein OF829_14065 [Sphingomonas sp. LB-2]|uniref:hypothetical protein n=1 Tax=Sphingomonas caeni TaxID=2984949 RepID=UPI0022324AB6|nr:hypothetical protein [Sphingomonas caeni]MCW3848366.1 hypothetical protein [Sphingomonas caeni]